MAVLIDLAFFVGGAANGAFLGFEVPKGDTWRSSTIRRARGGSVSRWRRWR
jgi:hypothetical protein